MPEPSSTRFLVLHGLRLKGFGEPASIGAAVGLDEDTVAEQLEKLRADELAVHREGRLSGWALTPAGREEQQRLAAEELARAGLEGDVTEAYTRFLALNQPLLALCTEWQVRGTVPNDHADAEYDAAVIARLEQLHVDVQPVLVHLSLLFDRYAPYALRFATAMERLRAGETEYFTRPIIDSFHTVWFELHEDLLSTLGRQRSEESA